MYQLGFFSYLISSLLMVSSGFDEAETSSDNVLNDGKWRETSTLENIVDDTTAFTNPDLNATDKNNGISSGPVLSDNTSTSTWSYNNDSSTRSDLSAERVTIDDNNYIEKVTTPLTVVVGVLGNVATMIALRGKPFNLIPSSVILSSLALADSLTLITIQFHKAFVINLIGLDVRATSRAACKTYFFAVHLGKILSAWFVVLVCFERFMAICLPFRAKRIITKANALKGIAVVVAVGAGYSGIWTLSSDIRNSTCNPTYSSPQTALRARLILAVGSGIIGVLPMIILVILTPVMCGVLLKFRNVRKSLTTTRTQEEAKVSTMLILLCVTYVILQLPLIIAHNLASIRDEVLYATQFLPLMILFSVGSILESINYSCNFFLYIATNSMFRRKVFGFCGAISQSSVLTSVSAAETEKESAEPAENTGHI